MRIVPLALGGLILILAACGYRPPSANDAWVGREAGPVYVALFDNRTREPLLENYLADDIILRLSRSRVFELTEDRLMAGCLLTGSIEEFSTRAVAYDAQDRITEYRAVMHLQVQLIESGDGDVLWQDQLIRTEDFLATTRKDQQLDNRELAARQLSARLAEDLYVRLLNTF